MGLNRTPTAILEARGSFIGHKNRKEARAGEPVVTKKLGVPPKTFSDEQKNLWREFAKMLPPGVATYADRWAAEIVVCAMAKFRAGTIYGNAGVFLHSRITGMNPEHGPDIEGMQVEVDPSPGKHTGGLYESAGRQWVAMPVSVRGARQAKTSSSCPR